MRTLALTFFFSLGIVALIKVSFLTCTWYGPFELLSLFFYMQRFKNSSSMYFVFRPVSSVLLHDFCHAMKLPVCSFSE
jgi:hypothetical protein